MLVVVVVAVLKVIHLVVETEKLAQAMQTILLVLQIQAVVAVEHGIVVVERAVLVVQESSSSPM